MPQAQHFLKLN